MADDALRTQRPVLVNVILGVLTLLAIYSLFNMFNGVLWPLQRNGNSFFVSGLSALLQVFLSLPTLLILIISIIGLFKRKRWSWWLIGIAAASGVCGYFLSFFQYAPDGQRIIEVDTSYLVRITLYAVIDSAILGAIFRAEIKQYLGIDSQNIVKSLGVMFSVGLLILLSTLYIAPLLAVWIL